MSDAMKSHRAMACVLHLEGVACPGPRDGLVITTILGQLDDVIRRPSTPDSVRRAFKAYYDGLLVITGVWLEQQALIINLLQDHVDSAEAKQS